MTTNDNKIKHRELVKEECFIAIYNQKGDLKGVVRKDIDGGGAPQMFSTKKANYSTFLEILVMLSNLGKSWGYWGVQQVDKVGTTGAFVESVKVIPNLSTRYPRDIHPTPLPVKHG